MPSLLRSSLDYAPEQVIGSPAEHRDVSRPAVEKQPHVIDEALPPPKRTAPDGCSLGRVGDALNGAGLRPRS